MHFRGPLQLASVAVYTPSTSTSKREAPKPHSKRHGHQHLHKKHHEHVHAEKRGGDIVSAVIDGVLQTWENNYFGPSTAAADATPTAAAAAAAVTTAAADSDSSSAKSATSSAKSSSSSSDYVPVGDYGRIAYYNAKEQVADGLVFLGNYGDPSLSGTWDT